MKRRQKPNKFKGRTLPYKSFKELRAAMEPAFPGLIVHDYGAAMREQMQRHIPRPYRNLFDFEIAVGRRCEKRIFGEFDTEVCCSAVESIDRFNLTDEIGWTWVNHEMTQEDLDFLATPVRGKFLGPNGFFRIKQL